MLDGTGVWSHCVKISSCKSLLVSVFPQVLLASCFSSALAWVLDGLQSFQGCPCSSMGPPWAPVASKCTPLPWNTSFQEYFSSHVPINVPYHTSPLLLPFLQMCLFTYLAFLLLCLLMSPFCGSFCVSSPVPPAPSGYCPFQNMFEQR